MTARHHQPGFAAAAAAESAQLEAMVIRLRAVLAALQQDVAEAESRLGSAESAQIVEANEQLVLAALRSQTDADTAAQALGDVSRSLQLDTLTGLPNRAVLLDRLGQGLVSAKRRGGLLALLFLDLNDFKQVNDTLGHAVGDEVLRIAARRLAAGVRATDTVSRHGGDEFLMLLSEVKLAADATQIAAKIIAALAAPMRIEGHVLRLTASVGISLYPEDGEQAERLIDRADAAMYRAKAEGPGSFVFGAAEPSARPLVNLPSLASLRRPLTRHELAISEHERRLAELRQANEQLVKAALNAQELQAAAEQAQRKQIEFLGMLAHELRNPLTPIRNAAAALGLVGATESMLPRMQAIIERQVVHMSRLVDDLLDVSRIDTGKLRLRRAHVALAAVVDAAVDSCRSAMDTRLQRFSVELAPQPLEVYGDADRLVQIVSNLLGNASKYTPNDGEIKLSLRAVADDAVITVSDSGIGIAAAGLTGIFEPFAQEPNAIGFNGAGLGIGLTVVRELVGAHGGTVRASSAGPGFGSEFVVRLPLLLPQGLAA